MPHKNVVMITVDDLRSTADWGHFASLVSTPNIDRLMAAGTTFERAVTQVPLCNPSRSSVFTGQSPSHTGILDNNVPWYDRVDPAETLPAVLRGAGTYVAMYGKNFHEVSPGLESTLFDDYFQTDTDWNASQLVKSSLSHTTPYRSGYYGGPDNLRDAQVTKHAVDFLTHADDLTKPFFLAVGLSKPHLDWYVPKEFYDLYDQDEIRAAIEAGFADGTILPDATELADVPPMNRAFNGSINDNLDLWVDYIHGYLASVSYADSKIGQVLDTLASNPALAADTSILLWSDNGFHLGDKDRWEKSTPWREASEVPLVIVDPDAPGGQVAHQIVSLTDIFPTVLDLMNVPRPAGLGLVGTSLMPIVADPGTDWYDPDTGKGVALTVMYGVVSLRADLPGEGDFRYTLYPDGSQELYDISHDPNEHTNRLSYKTGVGLTPHDTAILATMKSLFADKIADAHIHISDGRTPLVGTDANDMFISTKASGSNNFTGGGGDDTYVVYLGTTITEAAGGGFDSVTLLNPSMEAKFVLPANVEMLEVTNNATGNASANWLYATGRSGTLSGLGGNDNLRAGNGDGFLLSGGDGNDVLLGRNGADTLDGGTGSDTLTGGEKSDLLSGGGGADSLAGEAGADTLTGGAGVDRLSGGADKDVFDFNLETESGPTNSDTILDFEGAGATAGDLIDLSGIDARTTVAGDQAFVFGGSSAGHLWITESKGNTVILGNTDADSAVEFRLVIADGDVRASAYTAADFIL